MLFCSAIYFLTYSPIHFLLKFYFAKANLFYLSFFLFYFRNSSILFSLSADCLFFSDQCFFIYSMLKWFTFLSLLPWTPASDFSSLLFSRTRTRLWRCISILPFMWCFCWEVCFSWKLIVYITGVQTLLKNFLYDLFSCTIDAIFLCLLTNSLVFFLSSIALF